MDYLMLARVGKLAALAGFFLPWVTVSCSGNPLLEATGWQLMTGDPQPAGSFAGAEQDPTENAEPNAVVILAFAALLAGLALSFVLKGRQAAIATLSAAVLAIALSFYSMSNIRSELAREIESAPSGTSMEDSFARAAAGAIRVEEEEGFWVSVGGMGAAGVLALLLLASGAAPARTEPEAPGADPPAA